jgi:hypothetical protein
MGGGRVVERGSYTRPTVAADSTGSAKRYDI